MNPAGFLKDILVGTAATADDDDEEDAAAVVLPFNRTTNESEVGATSAERVALAAVAAARLSLAAANDLRPRIPLLPPLPDPADDCNKPAGGAAATTMGCRELDRLSLAEADDDEALLAS
jgi:hypothetical protein